LFVFLIKTKLIFLRLSFFFFYSQFQKDNPNDEELKLKLVKCLIDEKKFINAIEFIIKNDIDNFNILSPLWYENVISLVEVKNKQVYILKFY
jgi:hypothetical protein